MQTPGIPPRPPADGDDDAAVGALAANVPVDPARPRAHRPARHRRIFEWHSSVPTRKTARGSNGLSDSRRAGARPGGGAIEPDASLPRACVIGAGSCGIAAAKVLYEARIPFDCFEAGPVVGGLWKFRNPNGLSGAYSTLEMNTSGPRMSYSDFPFGDEDYPPHEDVGDYFDRYVDHFGIRDTITFNTRVEHVEPLGDGSFRRDRPSETAQERVRRASSSATATTGTRAGPSRRFPASSPASRCTPTTTGGPSSSPASGWSSSAAATAAWTSPATPPTTARRPTSRCAAAST